MSAKKGHYSDSNKSLLTDEERATNHALAQRKYRDKQTREGFKRIEICVPCDLWNQLFSSMKEYGYDTRQPGRGIVQLLDDINWK